MDASQNKNFQLPPGAGCWGFRRERTRNSLPKNAEAVTITFTQMDAASPSDLRQIEPMIPGPREALIHPPFGPISVEAVEASIPQLFDGAPERVSLALSLASGKTMRRPRLRQRSGAQVLLDNNWSGTPTDMPNSELARRSENKATVPIHPATCPAVKFTAWKIMT